MIGYLLLAFFSFFLIKSFWKTALIIMIWCPVLLHVNVGQHYNLYGLLSLLATAYFVFFEKQRIKIKFRDFIFYKSYILLILSFLLAGIKLNVGSIGGFVGLFIFPFLTWYAKDRIKKFWRFIFLNISLFSIVLVSVGLIELYQGFNPVALYLEYSNIMSFVEVSEEYIRFGMFRCRSLTAWCSTYGVNCGYAMITLLLCNYYRRFGSQTIPFLISILLFIGVLSTGTRSVYVAVCIGLVPLILNYASKVKYILLLVIIASIVYTNNQEMFDNIVDSFVHSDEAGGSDTDMRISQFQAAYDYFIRHPLFGNGIGATSVATQKNAQLLGAESCIFIIMIDRGIFGFIAYGLFNIQMCWYLWSKRRYRFLIFIPLGILIGKIISLFPDIDETYPLLWMFILMKAIDDYYAENSQTGIIKTNFLGLIKNMK